MRQASLDLLNLAVFGLLALENIGLQGYNLEIIIPVALAGAIAGVLLGRAETRGIENEGQYHPSRTQFLILSGSTISIVAISLYAVWLMIIPFSAEVSVFAFVPAMILGRFVVRWRWEKRTGREVYSFGSWHALGTLYAVPKGMTWTERYRYELGQKELLQNKQKV